MEAKKISKEKLLSAGFNLGTDMGDGRIEYYYQKVDKGGLILQDFYLWDINGKFTLELLWEGCESEVSVELIDWKELELLFFAFMRIKLPLKSQK